MFQGDRNLAQMQNDVPDLKEVAVSLSRRAKSRLAYQERENVQGDNKKKTHTHAREGERESPAMFLYK